MQGRIVKIISNLYTVDIKGVRYECRARGKFRNNKISPMVGDICDVDIDNNYILEINPRINELQRPVIANIDKAIIITSCKEPNLSLNLLDKQLTTIIVNKVQPVIVFTKLDLLKDNELDEIDEVMNYYQNIGIKVLKNTERTKIENEIKNKLVVLTGQTGAGKSTLLNELDKALDLKTSPISKALGRGVHTTRHVELFEIVGGLIADTPGFSSLDLSSLTLEQLKDTFIEFKNYKCQFADCNHLKEQNCGVKDAVLENKIKQSRYDNYVKFIKEVNK